MFLNSPARGARSFTIGELSARTNTPFLVLTQILHKTMVLTMKVRHSLFGCTQCDLLNTNNSNINTPSSLPKYSSYNRGIYIYFLISRNTTQHNLSPAPLKTFINLEDEQWIKVGSCPTACIRLCLCALTKHLSVCCYMSLGESYITNIDHIWLVAFENWWWVSQSLAFSFCYIHYVYQTFKKITYIKNITLCKI